ncbi:MAG: hypothetical protein Q8930_04585 [Bacillota bacterium]|nr:hypothetical protein [Bacillota bacterium]
MELSKIKLPSLSNSFLIWIVVIFIILGFGTSSNVLGINFLNKSNDNQKGSRKHHPDNKVFPGGTNKGGLLPVMGMDGSKGFLGGNGLFLIAIVALLFILKDKEEKKEESIDDTPVVDYTEVDD